jgi:hypothetical protein
MPFFEGAWWGFCPCRHIVVYTWQCHLGKIPMRCKKSISFVIEMQLYVRYSWNWNGNANTQKMQEHDWAMHKRSLLGLLLRHRFFIWGKLNTYLAPGIWRSFVAGMTPYDVLFVHEEAVLMAHNYKRIKVWLCMFFEHYRSNRIQIYKPLLCMMQYTKVWNLQTHHWEHIPREAILWTHLWPYRHLSWTVTYLELIWNAEWIPLSPLSSFTRFNEIFLMQTKSS